MRRPNVQSTDFQTRFDCACDARARPSSRQRDQGNDARGGLNHQRSLDPHTRIRVRERRPFSDDVKSMDALSRRHVVVGRRFSTTDETTG